MMTLSSVLTVVISISIQNVVASSSSSDDVNERIQHAVKQRFQPNDLNVEHLYLNNPNLNIDSKDIKPPNWNEISLKGFWSSFAMIIVSEIGDKTFFIAAILAMKHSRFMVWLGAAGALFVMTVLAVAFGSIILKFIPQHITHYCAGLLFLVFAIKLLWEGNLMKGGEASDELREVEEELRDQERQQKRKNVTDVELGARDVSTENGNSDIVDNNDKIKKRDASWKVSIMIRSFAMTFISEIGDRSQITTIVLAAHKSPYGVVVGASLGHAICTAIAVLGGKFLASRISERNVTLIGGVLFLIFA
eukprot:392817_1